MPNKLPKFFDKHKICIICEGNEEYEYLKRLKDLNVWNEQYEVSLVNAGGNGNIPARYQDRYQNGADELVLVFCDTEKKPHEQYEDIKRKYIGTFASILSLFFLFWTWDDIRITSTQYKCVIIILLCVLALILAILWTCIFKRTKTIWESPSGKIKVCYSDIMKDGFDKRNKEEKLFVIPVNSCFDTIVDEDISTCSKPLVSPNSLHGRWIKTMVNKGFTIEEIDNKIHNCLEMQNLVPKSIIADEDKERGKREVYELGTVAMIRGNNNSTFLLLAISEYDKDNIAHTSVDDLEMCIKSLLNFYDQHGQGHRLVIPLMGTNLSRAGLSHNDSLRVITSLFQLYGDKIHGEVDVVIYKGDKDKVTLDI